uniref:Uncharacterized protein n=1 Tax=Rhizophora mucronata TaxID=61149 RepID=A0A2P2M4F7_RHIMU
MLLIQLNSFQFILTYEIFHSSLTECVFYVSEKNCRQTFVKALEPFVNWLEEAEEEE